MDTPKLTVHFRIDKDTGVTTQEFRLDGAVCPTVRLTSPVARQFAAYTAIAEELKDARAWLDEGHKLCAQFEGFQSNPSSVDNDDHYSAPDVPAFRIVKGLWFASIVVYAKCFTKTEGRMVKLEAKNVPSPLRAKHDAIMMYRNTIR